MTQSKNLTIYGCGGFGKETLEIIKANNKLQNSWDILGFVDDNILLHNKEISGYPVLGGLEWFAINQTNDVYCVCAIGDCDLRASVIKKINKSYVNYCIIIHPSAVTFDFVKIGEGTIINSGSFISTNITIGKHVHIDSNCSLGHDAIIGDFCRLNPNVTISGNVIVGNQAYLGASATVLQGIHIGAHATIGAGAVVTHDIPESAIAIGIPAKVIKYK